MAKPDPRLRTRRMLNGSLVLLGFALSGVQLCSPVCAQRRQSVPVTKRGSDLVVLNSNQRLHGLILGQSQQRLQVAIESAWLDEMYPRLAERWKQEREKDAADQRSRLIQRLESWIAKRSDDDQLVSFLEAELERIKKGDAAQQEADFFVVKLFEAKEVRSVFVQPKTRRQVTMLAWQEGVRGATHRSTTASSDSPCMCFR